jgi:hypothetical protein
MKASEILKVLEAADYVEVLKALVMFETRHSEPFAEAIVNDFMDDDNCTTIFDLSDHI